MKTNKLTPNFAVANIKQTVEFYKSVLGFNLIVAVPESQDGIEQVLSDDKEYVYALISKDNIEFMIQRTDSFKKDVPLAEQEIIGASVSFYMEIEGITDFYQQIRSKEVVSTEMKTTWYGMREFYLKDNNGYILGFAEKAE
ncbi:bleomycin resistance family protein [Bacteroidia bacterium]|nr:bleomycin resistance family protein [Bacteroidia bacterium]GHU55433.1 bleomycin resistance family protein [Bacteroidia bacterium]